MGFQISEFEFHTFVFVFSHTHTPAPPIWYIVPKFPLFKIMTPPLIIFCQHHWDLVRKKFTLGHRGTWDIGLSAEGIDLLKRYLNSLF